MKKKVTKSYFKKRRQSKAPLRSLAPDLLALVESAVVLITTEHLMRCKPCQKGCMEVFKQNHGRKETILINPRRRKEAWHQKERG